MRLFVGIALPFEARQKLLGLEAGLPGARWVAPKNLHVTVRFIGDVDNGLAEDIGFALSELRSPAFQMELKGVDFFGSARRVRSLWVGVEKCPALVHLHEKAESLLVRLGLDPQSRKFKPHVTLARFKTGNYNHIGPFMENYNTFTCAPFPVDCFVLFQSHLGHDGADYEIISKYPLENSQSSS